MQPGEKITERCVCVWTRDSTVFSRLEESEELGRIRAGKNARNGGNRMRPETFLRVRRSLAITPPDTPSQRLHPEHAPGLQLQTLSGQHFKASVNLSMAMKSCSSDMSEGERHGLCGPGTCPCRRGALGGPPECLRHCVPCTPSGPLRTIRNPRQVRHQGRCPSKCAQMSYKRHQEKVLSAKAD